MSEWAPSLSPSPGLAAQVSQEAHGERDRAHGDRVGAAGRAVSRDAEIEELYRDRYQSFRRALGVISGSYEAAHDVVQEAFARALANSHRYRGDGPLGAWVWSIAVRVALDQRRKSTSVPLDEALAVEFVEPSYDPELADAIRALPARRRLVFFLRYVADLSYEEIATVCEISEGTVAATIAQARAALIRSLNESSSSADEVAP